MVRRGPALDAVRRDPDLHALPVVLVMLNPARHHTPEPGGVLVVEPVLDIELSGPIALALIAACGALGARQLRATVDDVDERHGRLAGVGAPHGARVRPIAARRSPA